MKRYFQLGLATIPWLCGCGLFETQFASNPPDISPAPLTLSGQLRDENGQPLSASVDLIPLPFGSDINAMLALPGFLEIHRSNDSGAFRFDRLPPGPYAVEAVDSLRNLIARIGDIEVNDSVGALVSLRLQPPGRVHGVVTRGQNPLPFGVGKNEKILVRVFGTNRFAYTDSVGDFAVGGLAEGWYRLGFAAGDGHYLPAQSDSIQVISNQTAELPRMDLAWNPLAVPPSPANLVALSDSDSSVIRLRWSPIHVSNFTAYVLQRGDSSDARNDTGFRVSDTVFTDSTLGIPSQRVLSYRVFAINDLGDTSLATASVMVRVPGPATHSIHVLVRNLGSPTLSFVRLFSSPKAPGSKDSLPLEEIGVDSGYTGSDGLFQFSGLPWGRYTVEALSFGMKSLRVNFYPPRPSDSIVTLDVENTGGLTGMATRGDLAYLTSFQKDEQIQVSLAGTVYSTHTQTDGSYNFTGIPPGNYQAVFYALPEGLFLPDTVNVSISAGTTTGLSSILMRINPSKPGN